MRLELDLPDFAPIPLTRDEFILWARTTVGLEYSDKSTFIEWLDDKPRGQANCYGLLFAIAQKVGLLPSGTAFWKALGRAIAKHGEAPTLRAYMGSQMKRVRKKKHKPGDILLFRWQDGQQYENEAEALRRGRHHVAIDAGGGWVIHALDTKANLKGGVYLSQLNRHDWKQLHQVWSLRQYEFLGEQHG